LIKFTTGQPETTAQITVSVREGQSDAVIKINGIEIAWIDACDGDLCCQLIKGEDAITLQALGVKLRKKTSGYSEIEVYKN
jgi:hypothetical protein